MKLIATLTATLLLALPVIAEEPTGDFADGLSGGPDYWEVTGVAEGDSLEVRSGPSDADAVVIEISDGTILRNLGCTETDGAKWCQVESPDGLAIKGWVAGSFLREGAPPDEGDAMVAGTDYNATGLLPCTIAADAAVTSCEFGVTRGDAGVASLFITLPNAVVRELWFDNGVVTAASEVSSLDYSRAGDETTVVIDGGAETYTVPDVVILGD